MDAGQIMLPLWPEMWACRRCGRLNAVWRTCCYYDFEPKMVSERNGSHGSPEVLLPPLEEELQREMARIEKEGL